MIGLDVEDKTMRIWFSEVVSEVEDDIVFYIPITDPPFARSAF